MADVGQRDGPSFEVVRRGYDIDQVHEFLVRQAEAWRAELYEAGRRIADLEGEQERLHHYEAEAEQTRGQREALTRSLENAATTRDEMLAAAEQDIAAKRSMADADAAQVLAQARAEAADILADAEREAGDVRYAARARTDELLQAQEAELAERRAELDANYRQSLAKYQQTEQDLTDKVRELNSMREALIIGLEAIASGGLSALEDVSEQLAAVGIVNGDDSAVHRLVGGQTLEQRLSNGTPKAPPRGSVGDRKPGH